MDIDFTILLQLGILVGLMLILAPLLHRPLLQVLEAREQQTVGTMAEVRHLDRLSSADKATYEARMQETRHRAHVERERLRQSGREQARRIEAEVRQEVQLARQAQRQKLEAAEQQAYARMAGEQQAWAEHLANSLLARPEVRS